MFTIIFTFKNVLSGKSCLRFNITRHINLSLMKLNLANMYTNMFSIYVNAPKSSQKANFFHTGFSKWKKSANVSGLIDLIWMDTDSKSHSFWSHYSISLTCRNLSSEQPKLFKILTKFRQRFNICIVLSYADSRKTFSRSVEPWKMCKIFYCCVPSCKVLPCCLHIFRVLKIWAIFLPIQPYMLPELY